MTPTLWASATVGGVAALVTVDSSRRALMVLGGLLVAMMGHRAPKATAPPPSRPPWPPGTRRIEQVLRSAYYADTIDTDVFGTLVARALLTGKLDAAVSGPRPLVAALDALWPARREPMTVYLDGPNGPREPVETCRVVKSPERLDVEQRIGLEALGVRP